ncbi:MAG: TonB-dependent receptor [Acidobacteriota bacterium]
MDARKLLLLAGCLALAFTALCLPVLAQTSAGLKGMVVDKDGAPLPSARISIKNDAVGISQGAITDAKGEFRIVPLPAGRGYVLEVSFPGMSTIKMDVDINAGKVFATTITLRPSAELQVQVKVTAKTDVVNTETTTTSTTFSSEFIDALPILGVDYQDILTLAPGVTDVDGDGNPTIHGSRDVDVVTLVDGVSTNNPFTGQRGQELNLDSIEEIEVKTAGATVEYGRAQGGFVNIVTKSGGNEFEGRFSFEFRTFLLDGDGAGIDDPRLHGGLGDLGLRDLSFNDLFPAVSVSGPVVKDKAWYYFSAQYIQVEDPVNALTQAFVRSAREKRIFGKLTWQMSTNHKLQFTLTLDPQEYLNIGINSFTALESGVTANFGGLNLTLKETAIFNPNVFLDSTVQHFTTNPSVTPTLDADTNHNGILFEDRNRNNFIDATERDSGEDFDRDSRFDVFEDINKNGVLDPGEDRDLDGRLTRKGAGCEGYTREDVDCDGHVDLFWEDENWSGTLDKGEDRDGDGKIDWIDEDRDHDLVLDPGEDRNGNGILDTRDAEFAKKFKDIFPYIEDRNNDQNLNDRALVLPDDQIWEVTTDADGNQVRTPIAATYPYGRFQPIPRDRDHTQDQRTLRVTGPNSGSVIGFRGSTDYSATASRITLREDLTVYVSDWHGQHDMKFGGVVERETYAQNTDLRPLLFPGARPAGASTINPLTQVQLPAENHVFNEASSTTFGMYAADTYKPLPNLTLTMGIRFEREATDSFGYTPFDPVTQRSLYDRLVGLAGAEGRPDDLIGNNDGFVSEGYCSDPIFEAPNIGNVCDYPGNPGGDDPNSVSIRAVKGDLAKLKLLGASRLTQHHTSTTVTAASLVSLFPEALGKDPVTGDIIIDRKVLRERGAATFQEQEAFRLTNNNLAPRVSVSWDPWADSKTKVYLNWGRFYDRLFLRTVTPEEGPDTINRYYETDAQGVSANGIPNNGIGSPVSKAPPSASQVDRGLQTPFSDELTLGFERELAPELSLRFTYINKRYRDQLQDRDINHSIRYFNGRPLDAIGDFLPSRAGASAQRIPDNKPDLYIHNFFFNQIFRIGNINRSFYRGVEIQLTKRLSRKWQMDASYTYSRSLQQAGSFDSDLGDDPATVGQEFGYAEDDLRHVVKFNAITYLPKDWQVGTTMSWRSGLPYSVVSNFLALDNFDYPQFRLLYGYVPDRPDENGNRDFQILRRNDRRNDSVFNIDVLGSKSFVLGKLNAKVSFTVQNLLNQDHLRILTYEPAAPDRSGFTQIDSERNFGRRFKTGIEFEF